jgi:hypothetical protein
MEYYPTQDLLNQWMPLLRSLPLRLGVGLTSGVYLAWAALGVIRRRTGPLRILIGGTLAGFALACALDPGVVAWFAQIPYLTRLRVAMGLLSFTVFSITLESLRKDQLAERYALLWVATSGILFVFALFPQMVEMLRVLTGIDFTGAAMAVLITFLLMVAFHFSLALSRHQGNQSAAAQKIALLEQRIAQLEESRRDSTVPGERPPEGGTTNRS